MREFRERWHGRDRHILKPAAHRPRRDGRSAPMLGVGFVAARRRRRYVTGPKKPRRGARPGVCVVSSMGAPVDTAIKSVNRGGSVPQAGAVARFLHLTLCSFPPKRRVRPRFLGPAKGRDRGHFRASPHFPHHGARRLTGSAIGLADLITVLVRASRHDGFAF
jgi:hypothetical protein